MEFTLAWFWILGLIKVLIVLGVGYKVFKNKFKHNGWNITLFLAIVLVTVNPIKIEPTTDKVNKLMGSHIESSHVLLEKVTDDSFEKSTKIDGILDEDLK